MIEITYMTTFVTVVKHSSFTEASLRLGVAKSVVSRRISDLERRLGVSLLDRSSRMVRPTEVGGVYYAKCVRILESVEAANDFATSFNNQMSGRLRIVLPGVLGSTLLSGFLNEFGARHPELRLDVVVLAADLEEPLADEDGFDMAIHIGDVRENSLIARNLAKIRYVLCASPDYLARHGRPDSPEALRGHFGLIESPYGVGACESWRFVVGGQAYEIAMRERMRSNNIRQLMTAAEQGLGIVLAPEAMVAEAVAAGRLEVLLPECACDEKQVVAIYPRSRRSSQKVQALLAYMVERMAQPRNGT